MLVRVLSSAAGVSSEGDGVGAAGANGGGLGHTHVPPHAAATAERSARMNECTMSITLLVRALYSLCKSLAAVGERDDFSVLPEKCDLPCPTALQKTGGRRGEEEE